jgi:hypothetical protein
MTQQTAVNKTAALDDLYNRISRVGVTMGCGASRDPSSPDLYVRTPNGLEVRFTPMQSLSDIGNALSVQAMRYFGGGRKNDWMCSLGPNGWQLGQAPLSDADIRACLTPEGPSPV